MWHTLHKNPANRKRRSGPAFQLKPALSSTATITIGYKSSMDGLHALIGAHSPSDCSVVVVLGPHNGFNCESVGAVRGPESAPIKGWEPSVLDLRLIVIVAVDECAGLS